jgi:predicted patatin/cPLA2 family phospholipase
MRQYPAMAEAMAHRHEVYNETLEYILEKEKNGDLFVIRPPEPLAVGKIEHSVAKMQEAYQIGRRTMEAQLDALKAYLAK